MLQHAQVIIPYMMLLIINVLTLVLITLSIIVQYQGKLIVDVICVQMGHINSLMIKHATQIVLPDIMKTKKQDFVKIVIQVAYSVMEDMPKTVQNVQVQVLKNIYF